MLLEQHTQKAIWAHQWTSFSPDRRGETMIKDYSEELQSDIDYLQGQSIAPETITDYQNRYERFFTSWLSAKSRCASAMITGPANFPVRRNEKANRSEQKHYEVFREWRERAKKAIIRKAQPIKTFISEIDRYKLELEGMAKNHELMKQGNKMIAKAIKEGKDISSELMEMLNINKFNADWAMKWGFGLQNNNANMKRVEERIKILESKQNAAESIGNKEFTFEGGKVILNFEADRVQIKHDTKPAPEIISNMKSNGFKWSPSNTAWQRMITREAIYKTEKLLNINLS